MKHPDFYLGRIGNRLFQLAYLYSQVREGKIKDWYVQDYRLFEKYIGELRELLSEDITELPYTAIHVRKAGNPVNPDEPNYSDNPFYVNLLKTDYYEKAMSYFSGERFLVFSDDPIWCSEQKIFEGCEISYGTELEDFNKMASCKNIIIANSSYSYWAALLGPVDKKVVAPSPSLWYSDGNKERTVCPSNWIQI